TAQIFTARNLASPAVRPYRERHPPEGGWGDLWVSGRVRFLFCCWGRPRHRPLVAPTLLIRGRHRASVGGRLRRRLIRPGGVEEAWWDGGPHGGSTRRAPGARGRPPMGRPAGPEPVPALGGYGRPRG